MKKIDEISIDEIKEVFSKCQTNKEVMTFYGYKENGSGQRFVKALREKAGIDFHDYFNHITDRKHYEKNPKTCKACGCILPYEKRYNEFCSCNCAAKYNNVKRGKRSLETRVKISNTLKKTQQSEDEIKERVKELKNLEHRFCVNCGKEITKRKFCSQECCNEYKKKIENEKLEKWLNGENFQRGATQVPRFIRDYLFEIHNCKCEKCGWDKVNPITGNSPLEIHHIDGDCTNNRLDNLELLCPNCHSLTENNGSLNKNSKRFHRKKKTLKDE